jgi:hypothetical protein
VQRRQVQLSKNTCGLAMSARESRRRRIAAAHHASVDETRIQIDGTPEPFLTVGALDALWVAVRRHHDLTIMITARGIAPRLLVIEPIANLNDRLLGPQPEEL